MGWTWQCAKFYDRKGNIDRKAECDDLYMKKPETNAAF